MVTLNIRAASYDLDTTPDGAFVAIGEDIPMLLCGRGGTDEAKTLVRAAMIEMLSTISVARPTRLARFLAARKVDYSLTTAEGRTTTRSSVSMSDMAVGVAG